MNLGGFVPLTLCDFPGRVAAAVFTQGCNFRCPWCHNGHLAPLTRAVESRVDEAWVLETLARRRGRLEGLVVSGGEPTLQEGLAGFLARVKALGLAVKLDTNGSRPEVLRHLLGEGLLDHVAMDIKAPWADYARLTGMAACDTDAIRTSLETLAASRTPHTFRTTRVDSLLSEADYAAIRAQLPPGSVHLWQAFRADLSLDPALRPAAIPA